MQLVGAPNEELALLALAIGILGRVEAALGRSHLAQDVIQRLLTDPLVKRISTNLKGVEIECGELRIVVQHLLEVGHKPDTVD